MSLHIDPTNSPTAGRSTTLTLDADDRVLKEPGLNCRRAGVEICRHIAEGTVVGGVVDDPSSKMAFWPGSAVWTLRPLQSAIATVHEETAGQSYILGLSDFSLMQLNMGGTPTTAFQAHTKFNQLNDITNPGYSGDIANNSGPFLLKRWGKSTDGSPSAVSANSSLTSVVPQVPLPSLNAAMDRNAKSVASFPADQGFFLRWTAPGIDHDTPRWVWVFYFGEYAIAFGGSGNAVLYEYCHPMVSGSPGDPRWVKRKGWQYATPKQVLGTSHTLSIFPHRTLSGAKWIAFGNNQLETAQSVSQIERSRSANVSADSFGYYADPAIRGGDVDESPGHATKAGYIHFDSRRDIRLDVQISKLAWAASGVLTDLAESLGTAVSNTNSMVLTMAKQVPTGCTLTGVVKDASTQTTFIPGTDKQPYAEFTFGGDGSNTPMLFAYRMKQDEVVQTVSPGSFDVDVTRGPGIDLTLFSGDPSEETGLIAAHDQEDTHTRLKKRGRFRAILKTSYTDPWTGDTATVPLADGYILRPHSTPVGKTGGAGFLRTGDSPYPAPKWRTYALPWVGMHSRLAERQAPTFGIFLADPDDSQGRPFKVTDVIRTLLRSCGFDSTEIDIPDLSYRMYPGHGYSIEDAIINPGADIADALIRIVRNYLGAYLYRNPVSRKWTLLFGTQPTEDGTFADPVANFVTDAPGANVALHDLAAYPPQTYPITQIDYGQEPANFNTIIVSAYSTLGSNSSHVRSVAYAYNPISFPVPGASVTPNPEHPDWLGYALPYEVIDPSLVGETPADTWANVSWTCRRLYDFLCHGQELAKIECPLPVIFDSGLSAYRAIRFQDPVTLDGDASWLVKSATINYGSDLNQMAQIELIKPFPGQYFYGSEGTYHEKHGLKRLAAKTGGSGDGGKIHGNLAFSGTGEHRQRRYPLFNPTQVPLQDATGAFFSMPGWLVQTGGAG